MQAGTRPPWLPPWPPDTMFSRRFSPLEYYRALARDRARQRSRLTIYTYGHDDSQILRLGGWHTAPPAAARWERYPLEYPRDPRDPLAVPDLSQLPGRVSVEWVGSRPPAPPPPLSARSALRAWLVGAALVAVMLVLLRAVERCLDRRREKIMRRRSREWPTPNVRATSRQVADDGTVIIPGLEHAEPLPADLSELISIDLPPPYSECTDHDNDAAPTTSYHNKLPDLIHEDPPPPYSDCYVEFSNKNGTPSVLIFSRKRTPLVDRREITTDVEDVTEQNDDNTNTEENERASAIPVDSVTSNNDVGANVDMIVDMSQVEESEASTSAETRVSNEDDTRKDQDKVVFV